MANGALGHTDVWLPQPYTTHQSFKAHQLQATKTYKSVRPSALVAIKPLRC